MGSVTLLGDSILDNGAYVGAGKDVAAHLRAVLPEAWRVTLCAIDGTTTENLGRQLDRVPEHTTHVVLSLGGNDALEHADLLGPLAVASSGAALDLLRERVEGFAQTYGWALDAVVDLGRPVTVCTIYDANIAGPEGRRAVTALALFNDVILRAAIERRLDVLDLRSVCRVPEDFANDIEPSDLGGEKIARAIAGALGLVETAVSRLLSL